MRGEIIAIGDELTSGRILNTTSRFAAARLFAAGHELIAMTTVGDDISLISRTLLLALERADFVLVTGGLGSTTDDLTNEAVAAALDRPPVLYPEILRKIQSHSRHLPQETRASLEKLAWLPTGAHALHTEARCAGYFLVHQGKPIFFLPGVPHEMEELLVETVLSRLAVWEGTAARQVRQRLYRVAGLGEAAINQRLLPLEGRDPRVRIGYYPVFPEVHVSLTVYDGAEEEAEALLAAADQEITAALGDFIYGLGDETLAAAVGRLLGERGLTLAVAESCSGGLLAAEITGVAGASAYFAGGVIAYSNELKERLLGVEKEVLAAHGAVSAPVAAAMAVGLRRVTGAGLAVSVTGLAGPGGGSEAKPVGTVFLGLAGEGVALAFLYQFKGDRRRIQVSTAHIALDLVRRHLLALAYPTPPVYNDENFCPLTPRR